MLRALLILALFSAATEAVCRQRRVRKSWDQLRAEGGTTVYMNAIQEAIRLGYHQDFADVHNAQLQGTDEAHRKGSFMYWHRYFLLAYENMLRSLGDQYECVTIPYWNYYREANRLASSGGGATLLDVSNICSELISGGASRSNWANFRSFPGSVGLATTVNNLDVDHFQTFSFNIERTIHNGIHNWLGGTMASYRSPLDPIFYSHHGTIDALQTIYYDCKAGRGQSDEFKQTSTIAYHPWGGAPNARSGFTVHPSSRVARFFSELPDQYYQYVDSSEIPGHSYTYQLDSNFQAQIQNMACVGGPAPPTDPPVTDPPVTDPPVTDPPVTDPPVTDPPVTDPPVTDPPVTDPPVTDPPVTDPPVTDPPVTDPPVTDPPVTDSPVTGPPVTDPPVGAPTDAPSVETPSPGDYIPSGPVADYNVEQFYKEITQECLSSDSDAEKCKEETKDIECLCYDDLFGVEDFSAEFRKNFNVTDDEHAECVQTVIDFKEAVKNSKVTEFISVDERVWKTACDSHFGDARLTPEEKEEKNPKDIEDAVDDSDAAAVAFHRTLYALIFTVTVAYL